VHKFKETILAESTNYSIMTLIIVHKSLKTHSREFNIYALCSPQPVFLAVGRLTLLSIYRALDN